MRNLIGQVGVVHSDARGAGRMVQAITRSHWNHVIVHVGNGMCVSAEPHGTRLRPVNHYQNVSWSRFRFTRRQRKSAARWAIDHLDAPYNWLHYYAIGFALISKMPVVARYGHGNRPRGKALICTQLAHGSLRAAGIDLFGQVPIWPGSFGRYFLERGWVTVP